MRWKFPEVALDTREILKRVRRIEIRTHRLVNQSLAGQYHTVFKGRGMEFSGVREYILGDEIRTIDWNVTSRMGHLHVKKYVEERELTVVLLLDGSGSGEFGSRWRFKRELAAEVCALLAFSAIQNNDRVGLVLFTDQIEKYVPPRKGKNHVLRVIREALYFQPRSRGTDIRVALEHLIRTVTKRSVIFLISDFLADGFEKALGIANRKHDLIAVQIHDRREAEIPNIGWMNLEDSETGETMLVDFSKRRVRQAFVRRAAALEENRQRMFRSLNVDLIPLRTDQPYDLPLVSFFRKRARRLR